jgi:hypothetical protein
MASDSLSEALAALEAALEAGAETGVAALAEPVKALNAAAREALR